MAAESVDALRGTRRLRLLYLAPVLAFVGLGVFLGIGLFLNPREIPSPLIGRALPQFDLPPLFEDEAGFATADLTGQVVVLNFFASWCAPCRIEHPLLLRLANEGAVIYGVSYKDAPADAKRWLGEFGSPYRQVGVDPKGRVAIDLGVYGLPETYIIDRQGRIAYKQTGAITPNVLEDEILPLLAKLGGLPAS